MPSLHAHCFQKLNDRNFAKLNEENRAFRSIQGCFVPGKKLKKLKAAMCARLKIEKAFNHDRKLSFSRACTRNLLRPSLSAMGADSCSVDPWIVFFISCAMHTCTCNCNTVVHTRERERESARPGRALPMARATHGQWKCTCPKVQKPPLPAAAAAAAASSNVWLNAPPPPPLVWRRQTQAGRSPALE